MFSSLLENTFLLTLIFLFLSAIITVFVKGRQQDKCLINFAGFHITLYMTDEKTHRGVLSTETSGIELAYPPLLQEETLQVTSSIFYKREYPEILALVRYHNELTKKGQEKREKELDKTYNPSFWRKQWRKTRNFFNQARDTCLEIVSMFIGQAKKWGPPGNVLSSQSKSLNTIQGDVLRFAETAYDPILEKHIGKKIVFYLQRKDTLLKFAGILKDYTTEFISILDVNFFLESETNGGKADLVIPRSYAQIRHLAARV